MIEGYVAAFLVHGVMQVAWDIIIDRNEKLRKVTHKETINESTKLLVQELVRSREGDFYESDQCNSSRENFGNKVSLQSSDKPKDKGVFGRKVES